MALLGDIFGSLIRSDTVVCHTGSELTGLAIGDSVVVLVGEVHLLRCGYLLSLCYILVQHLLRNVDLTGE